MGLLLAALGTAACDKPGDTAVVSDEATLQNAAGQQGLPQSEQGSLADVTESDPPLGHSGVPGPPFPNGPDAETSHIIAKNDKTMNDGRTVCLIDFSYAGYPPQLAKWDEPCADITAKFMDQAQLEKLNRWERIDNVGRGSIAKRTNGQVLYIEGTSSAAVYPLDDTNTPMETFVAD